MPASMKSLAAARDATGEVLSVLCCWEKDKLYYTVQVKECDPEAGNCKVEFEDGYKCWLDSKVLHCQLAFDKLNEAEVVCCVCEGDNSKPPNDIIMCDWCQQGYHLNCHQPPLDRSQVHPDDDQIEWLCDTCQQIAKQQPKAEERAPTEAEDAPATSSSSTLPNQTTRAPSSASKKKTPAKTPAKSARAAKTPRHNSAAPKSQAAATSSSQPAPKSAARTRATPAKTQRVATPKIKLNKRASENDSGNVDKTPDKKKEQGLKQAESQMANINLDAKEEQEPPIDQKEQKGIIVNQLGPLVNPKMDLDQIKSSANVDSLCSFNEDNSISTTKPTQPNEGRVEKMSPLIIQTARALAKEPDSVGTDQFVQVIGENHELMEALRGSKGGKVTGRKRAKSTTAAAF